MHGLPGVGVFAVQDPEERVNPRKQERHTESAPERAQDIQFEREEHTEPIYSQAVIPEENVFEANPSKQTEQLVSVEQVRQFSTQFLETRMLLRFDRFKLLATVRVKTKAGSGV